MPFARPKKVYTEEELYEYAVGALAETNYSFNGSVPDVVNLERWPHEVAAKLRQEQIDAILLTPA